jgi:hypothetical protein
MIKNKVSKLIKVKENKLKEKTSKLENFELVKSFVPKLKADDYRKIKAFEVKNKIDVRLSRKSASGCKLLNLIYSGDLKKYKGKSVNVLTMSKGVLHTLNRSDRFLLSALGLMTGIEKTDVTKFYSVGNEKSRRKALEVRIK